ncbi:hypothetical protein ACEWY4_026476 [Coilia grayii]|uniref:Gypsy retrotransposon integrase-like protein 1 n=1 Tax=Coilia grayii TaxID=363190 RepID=A0ABD1IV16_9TELE
MTSGAQAFADDPTEDAFHALTKDQLIEVARLFEIELSASDKRLKTSIKSVVYPVLIDKHVLPPVDLSETIRLKELSIKEKELDNQREELRLKVAENQLKLRTLENEGNSDPASSFDVTKHIKLVPPFVEKDVENFFLHFEKVALTLRWPRDVWPLLIQSVLTGHAQQIFVSLPHARSSDYDEVKSAILRGYQLVPEAYRQRFRRSKKSERQTYVEFARDKELLFDRWCSASEVYNTAQLRELMLLEEFKNCLPAAVTTYLNERQVITLHQAAVLADEFVLTHRFSFKDPKSRSEYLLPAQFKSLTAEQTCHYCKRPGHVVADCAVLKKRHGKLDTKPIGLIKTCAPSVYPVVCESNTGYEPFLSDGFVSLPGDKNLVPVRILRDTGAALSFLLGGVLPLSDDSKTGTSVLVRGFEMGSVSVPLHRIELSSDLVTGSVAVGVRSSLPIPGVTFILGNDIAFGNVWAKENSNVLPQVSAPDSSVHECVQKYPDVFPACAVTRAMARRSATDKHSLSHTVVDAPVDLSDSFLVNVDPGSMPCSSTTCSVPVKNVSKVEDSLCLSREKLISAQKADVTLAPLLQLAASDIDLDKEPQCLFFRDGVLMRKWRPCHVPNQGTSYIQVVLPVEYRDKVLSVAHDGLAGHLGIAKTLHRINQHFFWPGVRRDVVRFCKTCRVCQLAGKPNQTIPPVPLYPIPVLGEPFSTVIVDIVGPHTPRGPLAVIKDECFGDKPSVSILSYLSNFRSRLRRAWDFARDHLQQAQCKMKAWYDRKAVDRHFVVGDKILMLLPVPGSALEARFTGPYDVLEKVSDRDYLIATPDRRQPKRLCHVNMLKPFYERDSPSVCPKPPPPADSALSTDGVVLMSAVVEGDDDVGSSPCRAVVEGRLNNTAMLSVLNDHLPHLSQCQRADILGLVHQFPELFGDVPKQTHVLKHDIDVGSADPIKQHPYRVNPAKREVLRREVEYMLANGIAEHSISSWSSPCLLVAKPDHTFRFCTDYRRVNAVTKPDCYPLPRIDDCIDRVGSAVFVSKFDLLKGYWQIPLTNRAKDISAFVTPDDFLSYRVMAFGMRKAPASFQRLINTVLSGMSNCEAFLDDVVVYSSDWLSHLAQIRDLFHRLSSANLTINLAKCEFGKATVTYLGRLVGGGKVRPLDAKISAICDFPAPADRRELRRFLGMAGYYRAFCKNFSAVVAPLTDLLSPKVPYVWSEQCSRAFENLKSLLIAAPVLSAPDFSKFFLLAVDACDYGAGAVLLQPGVDGINHPVCYFSKKFSHPQRSYSTIEKEALALVLAVQHFEVYLGASQNIIVYTDHDPLKFLWRMRNANQRLMRWSLILQPFNLEIKHTRGTDNVVADALSRVP